MPIALTTFAMHTTSWKDNFVGCDFVAKSVISIPWFIIIFYISFQMLVKKQRYTVKPRYKEVGFNKTLLEQGTFAGPSSLYFIVFSPWYNEKPDITR